MLTKYRRFCLGVAFVCGALLVQPSGDCMVSAQAPPLPVAAQPPLPLAQPPATPLPQPTPYKVVPTDNSPITNYLAPYPTYPKDVQPYRMYPVPGLDYWGMPSADKPAHWNYQSPPIPPEEKVLPINLVTALRLANAQAWDIGITSQQVRIASAQLTRANVLWLPTLVAGTDYQHHDGQLQSIAGPVGPVNRNALELGGGPEVVFATTEAIFEPLYARQIVKARKADLQSITNDTTFNVARAYFTVQEARGVLAGTLQTIRLTKEVVKRIEQMAPGLVPVLEVARARAQLAQIEQAEATAVEQSAVAGAELSRIVRLDPSAAVLPIEPPHMQITLISPDQPLDNLLPVALASRPELVSIRAQSEAALKRWREEQFRPALPSVYFRGGNNQLPDTMMFGAMTGGANGTFGELRGRADYEVQVMWELQNLGFGNAAAMRQRRAEYDVSRMQAYRLQDFVAREVAEAYALVRSARARLQKAEIELQEAEISAKLNLEGLGEVYRFGIVIIPTLRPQEAVVAMNALQQAFTHYYGTVADYNRAQFQLYRALGNPAQLLPMLNPDHPDAKSNPNPAPPPPAAPPVPPVAPPAPNVENPNPAGDAKALPADAAIAAASAKTTVPGDPLSATMTVRLPASAELLCDNVKMTLTGSERNFFTPPLPPGRTYPYELKIRYLTPEGRLVERNCQVQVQAGQKTVVDFLAPAPK